MREQRLGRHPAGDRPLRRRRLHHRLLAGPAGVARAADHLHPQHGGDDVEHLARVLADDVQGPAAAGAALVLEVDQDLDPRQVRRQGAQVAPPDPGRPRGCRSLPPLLLRRLGGGRGLLEVLQAELQLVRVEPLRAPAEPPTLQLPDQQPQLLDLGLSRVTLGQDSSRSSSVSMQIALGEQFWRGRRLRSSAATAAAATRGLAEDHPAPATWRYSIGRKPRRPGLPLTRPCSGAGSRGAAAGATASPRAITRRDAPGAEGDLALPDEVEVTDPAHPLHGRRFRLLSASRTVQTAGHVRVEYRPGILLMLPIPATSLRPAAPRATPTKLCLEAMEDLVGTAGESEEACPSSPATSGEPCRRARVGKSSPTSPRSSGR